MDKIQIDIVRSGAGNGNVSPFAIFGFSESFSDYFYSFPNFAAAIGVLIPYFTYFTSAADYYFRWDYGGGGNTSIVSSPDLPYKVLLAKLGVKTLMVDKLRVSIPSTTYSAQFKQNIIVWKRDEFGTLQKVNVVNPYSFFDPIANKLGQEIDIPFDKIIPGGELTPDHYLTSQMIAVDALKYTMTLFLK